METIRRTLLAFLMAFSLLGLAACDGDDVEEGVAGGGAELEESIEPEESLD